MTSVGNLKFNHFVASYVSSGPPEKFDIFETTVPPYKLYTISRFEMRKPNETERLLVITIAEASRDQIIVRRLKWIEINRSHVNGLKIRELQGEINRNCI